MVRLAVTVISAAALTGCAAGPQEGISLFGDDPTLNDFSWLAGAWFHQDGDATSEEHWTHPHAGTLLGVNRLTGGGKTIFFEYLRIEARPDGVYYVACPLGRPGTDFKLVESSPDRAVFENPEHDFPRRISYWRIGDELRARIEGDLDGQLASEDFYWRRARVMDGPPIR